MTVVPVTPNLQRAGDPARTTVQGSSFSVDVADAPQYAVRVSDGETAAGTGRSESNSVPPFPGRSILGAIVGMVLLGLAGYHLAPETDGS